MINKPMLFWMVLISVCCAQSATDLTTDYLGYGLTTTAAAKITPEVDLLGTTGEYSINRNALITGIVLATGGACISLAGHLIGEAYYDKYKKSAFTENTDKLRNDVQMFNVMRIGGGVIGAAGLILIIFSF